MPLGRLDRLLDRLDRLDRHGRLPGRLPEIPAGDLRSNRRQRPPSTTTENPSRRREWVRDSEPGPGPARPGPARPGPARLTFC